MTGIGSTAMMTAMMSASTAMMQVQTQSSMRDRLNGRAQVLETEIELNGGRGGQEGPTQKQEELSRVQQAAQDTAKSQMGVLGKVNEAMKEAARKDQQNENAQNDSAGKKRVDQVELSKAGEKEAEKEQKTIAKLSDAAAYNRDGSLNPQTASAFSFGAVV